MPLNLVEIRLKTSFGGGALRKRRDALQISEGTITFLIHFDHVTSMIFMNLRNFHVYDEFHENNICQCLHFSFLHISDPPRPECRNSGKMIIFK